MGYYLVNPTPRPISARILAMRASAKFCEEFPGSPSDEISVSVDPTDQTVLVGDGTNTKTYTFEELSRQQPSQ